MLPTVGDIVASLKATNLEYLNEWIQIRITHCDAVAATWSKK